MQFFLFILFFCFVIFLFYLHVLSKEDFVFIRKNVSLENLFNIAFLTGFAALFCSRLFFVLFHPSLTFLNPLAFFGIPYFPGLSLSGALVGGVVFLYLYGRANRLPAGRISDFFSIPFLLALPFGFLGAYLLGEKAEGLMFLLASLFTIALFIFFTIWLFPKSVNGQYKDGTIAYLFLMNFPLVFLLANIIARASLRQFYFTPEDFVLAGLFILGFVLYLRQEADFGRRRSVR